MLPLEGFGPLLPEHLSEIIAGIVLFLICWLVIQKKVVPAFEATYEERAAAIQGGMEKAEKAQAEAAAALEEYKSSSRPPVRRPRASARRRRPRVRRSWPRCVNRLRTSPLAC